METETLWRLFWQTGLPQAFALASWLREAEAETRTREKTA